MDRHPTDPKLDRITEARYLTFGCTSAIAASEALCAIIEEGDFTPIDALKITNQDIVKYLDGLPQAKIHCSVMGAEALEAAVFNWAQKRGVDLSQLGVDIHRDEQDEGRVVCKCFGLTEPYLRRKIRELELHTISDILDYSKINSNELSLREVTFDLELALGDVERLMRHSAEKRGIALDFHYQPEAPRRFHGDPARIRQIVFHLVGNAIKYSPEGSKVTLGTETSGANTTLLSGTDNGPGIPPDETDLIFEPFEPNTDEPATS